MPTVDATVNGANANSFLTTAEAQDYWDVRGFATAWDNAEDNDAAVILATRTLVAALAPRRQFVPPRGSNEGYFIIYPTWTGAVATSTQALPWGRTGMLDRNGNAMAETVIPQELKDATAELAGQMASSDRLLDNDVAAQGITSVKAGSVAVTFKDDVATLKVIPDSVLMMLVPSWLTDMIIEPMYGNALFDVFS